ncbi:DUF5681 domain-containing protein [Sphingobium agri]|uniref:DUF5681 domain-containing protein n=1 Tax=Sphingobium agri TaxID=2933566 RepID=A0ABT0DV54_9SPHN|nr:DUF5681 domain-containing protein [Sphingobium agri]MCK0530832.1 hypothetical protein [Sphingobium agri]
MSDGQPPKPIKLRKDGQPDGRGHAEGSKANRLAKNDGRRRPGRPPGSRDAKSEICAVRDMPVAVVIGGRQRKVSTRMANLLKLREKALKGDQRAAEYLDRLFAQVEPPSVEPDLTASLLEEDAQLINYWLSRKQPADDQAISATTDIAADADAAIGLKEEKQ